MMAIRVIGSVVLAAVTAIALVDPSATGASPVKVEAHTGNLSARSKEIVSIAMVANISELAPNASPCRGLLNDPRAWTYANVATVGE
jgi:hypothetical protein